MGRVSVIGTPLTWPRVWRPTYARPGYSILLTEATRRLLSEKERDGLEERGEIPLRGKSEPVPVYAADFRADNRPIPRKGYIKAEA